MNETNMEGAQDFVNDHAPEIDECEGCLYPTGFDNLMKTIKELILIIQHLEGGQQLSDSEMFKLEDTKKWLKAVDEFAEHEKKRKK
jgi:hypothetical protein